MLAMTIASLHELFADEQVRRLLLIGAAIIAMFFMMLSMRRWQQRAQQPRREPLPPARPPSVERELRRDLEALMVELQELSRKISAEIDTRFVKLEAAMRDADRRIAALNRLSRGQEPAPLAELPSAGESNLSTEPDSRHQVVYELADAGFGPVEIARDLGKTPGEVELILNLRPKANPAQTKPG
jgi:hypothetical protein